MVAFCVRLLTLCAWAGLLIAQETSGPKGVSSVERFTELAFKYGPFAFAILFGLAVWWLIRGARAAASSRESSVKAQARNYWAAAVVAGVACIAFASIGTYHWVNAESAHFFSGEIKDLKTYEDVDADEFFQRRELKQVLGASAPLYNLHFLVMQAQAFAPGQRFEIAYSKKDSDKRKTFVLSYDGEKRQSYRFEYDDMEIPVKLVKIPTRVESAGKKNAALAPFAAYAQTIPALIPTVGMSAQVVQGVVQRPPSVDLRMVNMLQEARTGVGAKIDALDRLLRMDATALKPYSETITEQEPFALTLIELSRHSDKELATKARMVAEKSGAESALARQLGSPRPEVRAAAELAVSRVSGERADRILKSATQSARTQQLMARVRSGENQQILTPVGSERGDRYYVKANWDAKDQKTASCLTQLFNRELGSSRSVQDEQKIMAGKGERLVYWYTKEWALSMAEKIRGCGGKASFPQPKR